MVPAPLYKIAVIDQLHAVSAKKVFTFNPTPRTLAAFEVMRTKIEAKGLRPTISAMIDMLARASDGRGVVTFDDAAASGFTSGFRSGVKNAIARFHAALRDIDEQPAPVPARRRVR